MSKIREQLDDLNKSIWSRFQELLKESSGKLKFIETEQDLDDDENYFEFRNKYEEMIHIHVISFEDGSFEVMDSDDQDFSKTFVMNFLEFDIFDRITLLEMIEEKLVESK